MTPDRKRIVIHPFIHWLTLPRRKHREFRSDEWRSGIVHPDEITKIADSDREADRRDRNGMGDDMNSIVKEWSKWSMRSTNLQWSLQIAKVSASSLYEWMNGCHSPDEAVCPRGEFATTFLTDDASGSRLNATVIIAVAFWMGGFDWPVWIGSDWLIALWSRFRFTSTLRMLYRVYQSVEQRVWSLKNQHSLAPCIYKRIGRVGGV